MTVAEMFTTFLDNLAIKNREQISDRYGEITRCLNKKYRDTDSKTSNSLQVGSYGRDTAIDGISDLDMIYILPKSEWERFKDNRQSALLQEVKNALMERYPNTEMSGDGQVVTISFTNHKIEIVPAFELDDGRFKFPDTNNGGSWKETDPRSEIKAISDADRLKNYNLRCLCRMVRAWKNKHGIAMGGLLIDTLAHNFLQSTTEYDKKSYLYYDWLNKDFFKYLMDLPKQEYYLAPGSNQYVIVKKSFQRKAKKAHKLCIDAIEAENQKNVNDKWKKVFGRPFPVSTTDLTEATIAKEETQYKNTEEFIEDKYPVDIRNNIEIDCHVTQNGFRTQLLGDMIERHFPLRAQKGLEFHVVNTDVPRPYQIEWKVLNRGDEAKKRDMVRGQIVSDNGTQTKKESTTFRGDHVVDCYAVKDGVVVAKDRIHVPIQ